MKKIIFLTTMLMLLFTACINEPMDDGLHGSKYFAGDTIPEFRVITTDSVVVQRNNRTAPLLFVLFFHTECGDCQKELPVVEQVYQECRNDSLWQLICIGRNENAIAVKKYWEKSGFTMPVAPQADRTVYDRFAHNGVPMLYVVNNNNVILSVYDDRKPASYQELKKWITLINEHTAP